MSRRPTSAKLSARSRIASIASRSTSSMLMRLFMIEFSCQGLQGRGFGDGHLVDPVGLLQPHVDPLLAGRGQVLADVIGAEGKLAVAAVAEDGELDPLGAAVVEKGLDRGADRAAGEEDVVDEDDGAGADVVAVEGDVDVADRQVGAGQLAEEGVEATGEDRAAGVDADHGEPRGLGVLLGDLMGDPPQGSPQIVVLKHDLLTHFSLPSWPLGTWLKDVVNVARGEAGQMISLPHELRGGSSGTSSDP